MNSDRQQTDSDRYPGIEESAIFEKNKTQNTTEGQLYAASDEEIKQSVRKINPDVSTLDRG